MKNLLWLNYHLLKVLNTEQTFWFRTNRAALSVVSAVTPPKNCIFCRYSCKVSRWKICFPDLTELSRFFWVKNSLISFQEKPLNSLGLFVRQGPSPPATPSSTCFRPKDWERRSSVPAPAHPRRWPWPSGGTNSTFRNDASFVSHDGAACVCVSSRPVEDSSQPPGRGVLSMQGLSYGVVRVDTEERLSVLTVQDVGTVIPGGKPVWWQHLQLLIQIVYDEIPVGNFSNVFIVYEKSATRTC